MPVGCSVKLTAGLVMNPVEAHLVRVFLMVATLYTVCGLKGPCMDGAAVGDSPLEPVGAEPAVYDMLGLCA